LAGQAEDAAMITHKLVLALVALTLPASSADAGTWKRLPAAPISPEFSARTSVWTGKEMLVFGRDQQTALDKNGHPYATGSVNVAAAYNPGTGSWRKLSPPTKTSGFMGLSSVWTGKEMLVWGQGTRLGYNPSTDRWRQLPNSRLLSVHDGFGTVVWTGHEMLGWGGGCCGDAFSDGVAYNPRSNSWRALARAPLPGSQHPLSAWTGKEMVVVLDKRAAAYNPARNTWRRLAAPPTHNGNATALWDGQDVVVAGASRNAFEYIPAKNRWLRLPQLPASRVGKLVVWDGNTVLVLGGKRGGAALVAGAWTPLARGPLPSRIEPTAVWTGKSLVVWGGVPTKTWGKYDEVGAIFTPPVFQSCGDSWMAENLRATQSVKAGLRAAYAAAHPGIAVGGPAAGQTYYGRYSGVRYALATFGSLPTIFRTDGRNRWQVRKNTRGSVCSTVVPVELLKAWSLRPVSRSCYALPS
jgi:hypothetical protein